MTSLDELHKIRVKNSSKLPKGVRSSPKTAIFVGTLTGQKSEIFTKSWPSLISIKSTSFERFWHVHLSLIVLRASRSPKVGVLATKRSVLPHFNMQRLHKPLWSCNSANCYPILMKIGTQTNIDMISPKNSSPGVRRHFPRWPPPPCWKTFEGCNSAISHSILRKFSTQIAIDILSVKHSTW